MLHNKRLWFSGLAVAVLMVCGQASAFKSGNWNGDANNDDDGKFRDCTMLAEYNSGITLAFIITRDFDWGLVLANDKWNLEVGSTQQITLAVDSRQPIPATAKPSTPKGYLSRWRTPARWSTPCVMEGCSTSPPIRVRLASG